MAGRILAIRGKWLSCLDVQSDIIFQASESGQTQTLSLANC